MAKKATILIVDREKILVDLLIRTLSNAELSVFGTTSSEEAQRLVDLHGPDLLVIDPAVQGGMALLGSIVYDRQKMKLIVAAGSSEIREQARAIGIQETVDRNAGLDALVAAIRSALPRAFAVLGKDSRVTVLIVDDEDELRSVLAEFLSGRGYAVSGVRSGKEALEYLGSHPVQVVLLDVMMPAMGGMEVLTEVMGMDPHPNVIMMTAVADRELARRAMKIGAFDYILKPFDFGAIEASITACVSHVEYQKQPWWRRLTGG
jgi:DNA-binding NtrC family response regulator